MPPVRGITLGVQRGIKWEGLRAKAPYQTGYWLIIRLDYSRASHRYDGYSIVIKESTVSWWAWISLSILSRPSPDQILTGQEGICLAVVDTGITCRWPMKTSYTFWWVTAIDVVNMKSLEAHACHLKSMAGE